MQRSPLILDRIGRTPMVRLNRVAAGLPATVLGKCEFLNPGGSIKDRIALAIVEEAELDGRLAPGATLVEATAGNTGLGLALVAAARGYRLVCVLPEKMSVDKRVALEAVGAEVIVTANAPPSSPENFQNVARRLAVERGWFLTDQFANPANPRVHETTTGPEILAQCGGRVGAFVCGVGTGGTITGVGRFLKAHCPGVRIVLADPVGSRLAHLVQPSHPDHDAAYQVEGIGGSVVPPYVRPWRDRRGRAGDGRGVVRGRSPVDPGGGAARRGLLGDDCRGGVATRGTRGLRRSRRRRSGRLMGPIPVPAMAPAQLTKRASA